MLEVKIFENYEAVEAELSATVDANIEQTDSIKTLITEGEEDLQDFTIRPLIEIRTDGEDYWLTDTSIDILVESDDERIKEDISDLAWDVVKYIQETKKEAKGARVIPFIYTVNERTYADDDEEEETQDGNTADAKNIGNNEVITGYSTVDPENFWTTRPTEDFLQISADASPDDLKEQLATYDSKKKKEPTPENTTKPEPEYDRGLTTPELREFVLFARMHERTLYDLR